MRFDQLPRPPKVGESVKRHVTPELVALVTARNEMRSDPMPLPVSERLIESYEVARESFVKNARLWRIAGFASAAVLAVVWLTCVTIWLFDPREKGAHYVPVSIEPGGTYGEVRPWQSADVTTFGSPEVREVAKTMSAKLRKPMVSTTSTQAHQARAFGVQMSVENKNVILKDVPPESVVQIRRTNGSIMSVDASGRVTFSGAVPPARGDSHNLKTLKKNR